MILCQPVVLANACVAIRHDHHIVGPLDFDDLASRSADKRRDCATHGDAHHEAQRWQHDRLHLRMQQQRAVQPAFGAGPRTALTPVTGHLSARSHHEPLGFAGLQRAFHLVVRGGSLIQQSNAKTTGLRDVLIAAASGLKCGIAHRRMLFPTLTFASVTGTSLAST